MARDAERIFDRSERTLPGISFDRASQRDLLEQLAEFYDDQPFPITRGTGTRFYLENGWFGATDGLFLHLMLRYLKPKRLVEVGSGFSSLAMLDTKQLFFDERELALTFIEPNPERLLSRVWPGDENQAVIIERRVQDVDAAIFASLASGDVLFIDSSHVAKAGSDVNYLVFDILPKLAPGTFVHFHDVPYPFEYPQTWVGYGYGWNEAYLLRAFLQHNADFRIRLWNDYAVRFERDFLRERMPLALMPVRFGVSGSLWLERSGPR